MKAWSTPSELAVNPDEAQMVCWIFEQYLFGKSLGKIAAGLERQGMPSPTGKSKWNREAIDKLLSNGYGKIPLNQQNLDISEVALI